MRESETRELESTMFFTHLGHIVAFLALVLGIFDIVLGVSILTEIAGPYASALARYAPGKPSSGQLINGGIYLVLGSIVLGILTEIRYALRAPSTQRVG
jgi:hypothetical protein